MSEDITHKIKEILAEDLDWDYIMENSQRHGISPLLYWNVRQIDLGKHVPETVMTQLKTIYHQTVAQNMILYHELGTILKAFKDAKIEVICLKGAFLAEAIYKNIELRPLSDVDLLIKDKDLQKVKRELSRLMYQDFYIYPTKWHEQWWPSLCEKVEYDNLRMKMKITLGVHWHIQPPSAPFRIDINTFWENSQPIVIAGVETLIFAPEDLLQHLCVHLYEHATLGTLQLKWCCDIAEFIKYYKKEINWEYLVQSSQRYRTEEPMYRGLSFVNNYLHTHVPDDILCDLNPGTFDVTSEDIFKWAVKADERKKQLKRFNHLKTLIEVDGIWNKVRILFGEVFPCKEFMIRHYSLKNESEIYSYYLIRFRHALYLGVAMLWELLFKPKLKSEKT